MASTLGTIASHAIDTWLLPLWEHDGQRFQQQQQPVDFQVEYCASVLDALDLTADRNASHPLCCRVHNRRVPHSEV
jgi:hypothetical protein